MDPLTVIKKKIQNVEYHKTKIGKFKSILPELANYYGLMKL